MSRKINTGAREGLPILGTNTICSLEIPELVDTRVLAAAAILCQFPKRTSEFFFSPSDSSTRDKVNT
jgi:hypothetical protein